MPFDAIICVSTHAYVYRIGLSMINDAEEKGLISPDQVIDHSHIIRATPKRLSISFLIFQNIDFGEKNTTLQQPL